MAGRRKKKTERFVYTEEQKKLITQHIEKHFGTPEGYLHKKDEGALDIDISIIPPNRKKSYVTLVTTGMGAHVMRAVGDSSEEYSGRCELVICMPPGWRFREDDDDENDTSWPVHLLDIMAEFSAEETTWLSWGHCIDYGENFEKQTGFRGVLMIMAMFGKEAWECDIGQDENVDFYQVIPLFESEMRFRERNGSPALLNKMDENIIRIADCDRMKYVPDNFEDIIDTVEEHSIKIEEKDLDLPEINGADHIGAYLLWIIDHDMINEEFLEFFAEEFEQIRAGTLDVRKFLIQCLDGELNREILTDEGAEFTELYYDFYGDDEPAYPSDVDNMARDYFGDERYESDEFSDEAYLFVPFDEEYIKRMHEYIDKAYAKLQPA